MNIEVIRYRLPVYWARALINDDYTGLLDNEEQEIRNFLKRVKADPVSGRRYRWSRRVWVRRSGKRGVRPCSLDWLNR